MNKSEAIAILTKRLGFRVVDNRMEFVSFVEDKVIVRGVRPLEDWQLKLWNECISLTRQVGSQNGN